MSHPLAESLVDALAAEPWQTSHALLQRCDAERGDQVSDMLQLLRKQKRVQCRSAPTGLLWALADAPAPAATSPVSPYQVQPRNDPWTGVPRRPLPPPLITERVDVIPALASHPTCAAPALNLAQEQPPMTTVLPAASAQTSDPQFADLEHPPGPAGQEEPPEPIRTMPESSIAQIKDAILAALAERPARKAELAAAVGMKPGQYRFYAALDALAKSGKISQTDGKWSEWKLGPGAPEAAGGPARALHVFAEEASFRCALWDTGTLELHAGDISLVLPLALTRRLVAYLDRTLPDEAPTV